VVFNRPKDEKVCDHCGGEVYTRDDDRPEAVQKRLEVYRAQTAPLVDFYREKGLLIDIDASPMVDEIVVSFKRVLGLK
jgi:adenylate kinase